MRAWDWKNRETGEIVEHSSPTEPPDDSDNWYRIFSFGLAKIDGAGGSPARPSTSKEKQ